MGDSFAISGALDTAGIALVSLGDEGLDAALRAEAALSPRDAAELALR